MATRQPFWKWHICKSVGFCPWPTTTWALNLKLKLKLHYRNHATYRVQKHKKTNMDARQPFWKWHRWKSIGSFLYTQMMCHSDLVFEAKLKLESGNPKFQYGCQAAILKAISLTIHRLLPIDTNTNNMHVEFEIETPKQTWVMPRKPCHLQSPNIAKSNITARQPFWKLLCWKSTGSPLYTQMMCHWCLDLIFETKIKLESGNRQIQYGRQATILKVMSVKINKLLPIDTDNMHMKFAIEILKQTWLTLLKPCHLQTERQTDRQPDWQGESSMPHPHPLCW